MTGSAILTARSVLVLGGARSGKSRYAQALAEAARRSPLLIATARIEDEEMRARVERHRAERGPAWSTLEEPLELAQTLRRLADGERVVLVDCLTLWLANLFLAGRGSASATQDLASVIGRLSGSVIFVSNEVGSGIVPDNALARAFRDAQGRLNQAVAAACEVVVLVTAGLPQLLKPARPFEIRL